MAIAVHETTYLMTWLLWLLHEANGQFMKKIYFTYRPTNALVRVAQGNPGTKPAWHSAWRDHGEDASHHVQEQHKPVLGYVGS
jgi:hypothetical protein